MILLYWKRAHWTFTVPGDSTVFVYRCIDYRTDADCERRRSEHVAGKFHHIKRTRHTDCSTGGVGVGIGKKKNMRRYKTASNGDRPGIRRKGNFTRLHMNSTVPGFICAGNGFSGSVMRGHTSQQRCRRYTVGGQVYENSCPVDHFIYSHISHRW